MAHGSVGRRIELLRPVARLAWPPAGNVAQVHSFLAGEVRIAAQRARHEVRR